ncbi:MAG: hypothetical protein A3G34_02270 [Candidatus Lindowbacteria bacterium RIFCSPLOWO2_12_FULL_62_27]|nr:MAG: hypothetical protein A3G34_02270 [Candidatus Lindowbacteria bacterium RIFCSPLOWO2_12_FULL_62_27]OGH61209.1 MAG: hypothetical protein A3I06_15520 [Candidatus Lindowbacteria bacterium RIFCSPLOWO2_02_FULL_62_12]
MRYRTILAGIAAMAIGATVAGCKMRVNTAVPPSPGEKIIWKSHDRRPEWVQVQQGDRGGFYYATGLSDRFTTELDAREHAMFKARQAIADYVLGFVQTEYKESRTRAHTAGDGADAQVEAGHTVTSTARVAVSQVRPKEWYLEKVQTENGKVLWTAIVLAEAPRDVIQREVARIGVALKKLEQDTPATEGAKTTRQDF